MIKVFLILVVLNVKILLAQQTLLVVSDDFNSSVAKLYCFEEGRAVFPAIDVNLGRNGLAWDKEDKIFQHHQDEPLKIEGDGRSPAGVFSLLSSFGTQNQSFSYPYTQSSSQLICVDDINSSLYNTLVLMPAVKPASFEYMKREDGQYKLGIIVSYNPNQIKKNGSCIFLHVEKESHHQTAGCTSMKYDDIYKIIKWLDMNQKPSLIQIPKKYFTSDIAKKYDLHLPEHY
jgi:hypothetical protein